MKALFLLFHGFEPSNGISKKITYQVKALKECGLITSLCHYEVNSISGNRECRIDNEILKVFGIGYFAKLKKKIGFKHIVDYAIKENIDFVYMRSNHNANPFIINMVKQLKRNNIKTVMEIPTYPYDQEYITFRMKLSLWIDKLYRKKLAKKLDSIVTFSNNSLIFGQTTIKISNGIDFSSIPIKNNINDTSKELHLIGVAEVHYWHGFDRLIKGLIQYYGNDNTDYKVYFHIVGKLSGEREKREILDLIKEKPLVSDYIIFHGKQHGKELDQLFEISDLGVGSLGRHRSNITFIKTLKNREYAARGIPFIYSEIDNDFEEMPYIIKVAANETPIDIKQIIHFYNKNKWIPSIIRSSINHLSWKNQMEKVLTNTFI